jgi:hypothetical protein
MPAAAVSGAVENTGTCALVLPRRERAELSEPIDRR